MTNNLRLSALSPARQRLLRLMARVNFGRVENLRIVLGEPQWLPRPRVLRSVRFDGASKPRRELTRGDFVLKAEQVALLAELDAIDNGSVALLDVKAGMPAAMLVDEQISPSVASGDTKSRQPGEVS
jgi:hypothetical protein